RAIVGRAAFDRIGDVHILRALEPQGPKHIVEQAPGLADERLAALILFRARPLPYEHPARLTIAHAGNGLLAALAKHTRTAGPDGVLEGCPVERFDSRQPFGIVGLAELLRRTRRAGLRALRDRIRMRGG